MRVFVTRQYQFGEETGETRAYRDPESAKRWLESAFPSRERISWREAHPGAWFARIGHRAEGNALYVTAIDVLD